MSSLYGSTNASLNRSGNTSLHNRSANASLNRSGNPSLYNRSANASLNRSANASINASANASSSSTSSLRVADRIHEFIEHLTVCIMKLTLLYATHNPFDVNNNNLKEMIKSLCNKCQILKMFENQTASTAIVTDSMNSTDATRSSHHNSLHGTPSAPIIADSINAGANRSPYHDSLYGTHTPVYGDVSVLDSTFYGDFTHPGFDDISYPASPGDSNISYISASEFDQRLPAFGRHSTHILVAPPPNALAVSNAAHSPAQIENSVRQQDVSGSSPNAVPYVVAVPDVTTHSSAQGENSIQQQVVRQSPPHNSMIHPVVTSPPNVVQEVTAAAPVTSNQPSGRIINMPPPEQLILQDVRNYRAFREIPSYMDQLVANARATHFARQAAAQQAVRQSPPNNVQYVAALDTRNSPPPPAICTVQQPVIQSPQNAVQLVAATPNAVQYVPAAAAAAPVTRNTPSNLIIDMPPPEQLILQDVRNYRAFREIPSFMDQLVANARAAHFARQSAAQQPVRNSPPPVQSIVQQPVSQSPPNAVRSVAAPAPVIYSPVRLVHPWTAENPLVIPRRSFFALVESSQRANANVNVPVASNATPGTRTDGTIRLDELDSPPQSVQHSVVQSSPNAVQHVSSPTGANANAATPAGRRRGGRARKLNFDNE